MDNTFILYPAFLMMGLTFFVYGKSYFTNLKEVKKKNLKYGYFKAYRGESPELVEVIRQTLKNQFELPVLFYFLISISLILDSASRIDLILAWLFVISRYVHCYIRLTSNYVPHRAKVFQIGYFALLIWMLIILYRLI